MQKELAIQKELVRWLKREHPDLDCASNNNEDARHQVDKGVDVGSTDLIFYKKHKNILFIFFLELKTSKGQLSANQKKWKIKYDNKLCANNTDYAVAYGLLDAKTKIEEWIKKPLLF